MKQGKNEARYRMDLEASHLRKSRLMSMRWSSVPQAIQSSLICLPELASSAGNSLSNSGLKPPELKAPIQANFSRVLRPVRSDSAPPMERPAMARELRSFCARYSDSMRGMTSVSRASRNLLKLRLVMERSRKPPELGSRILGSP